MIRQRKQLNSMRQKIIFCGMTVPKYLRTNSGCSLIASEILIKIIPFHLTTFEGRRLKRNRHDIHSYVIHHLLLVNRDA
jgi:hypothetical protein